MVKKRGTGIRAEIYLDSIDYQILSSFRYSEKRGKQRYYYISILELAKLLNIKHISLKPHIDKLVELKLIILTQEDNKVVLTTPYHLSKYAYENLIPDVDFNVDDDKKEVEKFNKYFSILEELYFYNENEKNKKILDLDLRKTKTGLGYAIKLISQDVTSKMIKRKKSM